MSFGVSSKGQENAGLKLGHVMGQGVEIIVVTKTRNDLQLSTMTYNYLQ